jgi:hypothetical protein
MVQSSWPRPVPPGGRQGTITLICCARCKGRLYWTKLKGQPRQEDHEQGCEAFIRAIRVAQYVDELKRAAAEPEQGSWRGNRRCRKYLLQSAKKLSVAACAGDPAAAVRGLSDEYQAECQAQSTPTDTTRMAEMLMKACGRLALGEAPAPITLRPAGT